MSQFGQARQHVPCSPDARVLAEASRAEPDWFVPHEKDHLVNEQHEPSTDFAIGTPGDLTQSVRDALYLL